MSTYTDTFLVNWGSDWSKEFNWPDGAGGNANLTGYTADVVQLHSALISTPTNRISFALITPATGLVRLTLVWDDNIPTGRVAFFRPRLISGSVVRITTNALFLEVR